MLITCYHFALSTIITTYFPDDGTLLQLLSSTFLPLTDRLIIHKIAESKHSLTSHAFHNLKHPEICLRSPTSRDSEPEFRNSGHDFQDSHAEFLSGHTASSGHIFKITAHPKLLQPNPVSNPVTNYDGSSIEIRKPAAIFRIVTGGTSEFARLAERISTEASQQERNDPLACSHVHRDIHHEKIQIEDHDTRSICILCDHTLVTIDREDWNRNTHGKASTRELLHNFE